MYTVFGNGQIPELPAAIKLGGALPLWVGVPNEISRSFVTATESTDRYILARDGTTVPLTLTCDHWLLKYVPGKVEAFSDNGVVWRIWQFQLQYALEYKREGVAATKRFRNIHHC